MPAREWIFVLIDANARTGRSGEGGGKADSKALGANGRDELNENGKLLLSFAKDNTLALLSTYFCTLKSDVSYTFLMSGVPYHRVPHWCKKVSLRR